MDTVAHTLKQVSGKNLSLLAEVQKHAACSRHRGGIVRRAKSFWRGID